MNEVQYIPANASDYETICSLFITEEDLFRVYPAGRFPLTTAQVEQLERERMALTVVSHKNQIIGFANLYDYLPGKYAFLGNVVIDANFRGNGVGSGLITHMLNIAHEVYQLPELRLSVFSDNTPALLLYHRLGFSPYGMEERTNPHGVRLGLIHMHKRLGG